MSRLSAVAAVLARSPVRVVFGPGALGDVGRWAAEIGARHCLVVTDPDIHRKTPYVEQAAERLRAAALEVTVFDGAAENPTVFHVKQGCAAASDGARRHGPVDLIVGLGGGSAMDCAKGVNLLLSCGGEMVDYRGDPTADALVKRKPLLPSILVPTTGGTGSEAQSFSLISDDQTHVKMACGDRRLPAAGGLRPRVTILDPQLTRTCPRDVAAAAGIDAMTHAIETSGSKAANDFSHESSLCAWRLISKSLERALMSPEDDEARADLLLGAHLAGLAIEQSMLGAAHAAANPLTAVYNITHGVAVGIMVPHVVEWNCASGENPYSTLATPTELAASVRSALGVAGLSTRLRDHGVSRASLANLAEAAMAQWTGRFNPRSMDRVAFEALYESAY